MLCSRLDLPCARMGLSSRSLSRFDVLHGRGSESMEIFWGSVWNSLRTFAFWRPRFRLLDAHRFGNYTDRPPPMHWSPCHESTRARFKASFTCPNGHTLTLRV